MDSAGASSSPFKSTKLLRSSVKTPDQSSWSSKTPEKPPQPARVHLTRRQSLRSVKQVREAANKLRISDPKPPVPSDPLASSAGSTESPIVKPSASKSLPEKYEMLNKFFSGLGSSIRLLRLKGSMSTFANISRQVQILTDRNFGYNHLAQLKFILPEAFEIKKILVRDDRTSCMKPDLHVTLNCSIVEKDGKLRSDSAYLLLNKLFRSRLVSFIKSNPEGDEVPEAELPDPFNRSPRSLSSIAIQKPDLDSVQDTTITDSVQVHGEQPIAASLISQSFKRRFSKQDPTENVAVVKKVKKESMVSTFMSPVKCSEKLPETETPIKGFDLAKKDLSCIDGTPVKLVSTPFSATPAQSARPPVRSFLTPDDEPPSKLTRRTSSKQRSITFDTPVKSKAPSVKRASSDDDDDDLSDILSHDLLASIKETELRVLEEQKPEISQAKWRKQMLARLPKLFDTLLFFFQSSKRTVITKVELVNKIISNQMEIVDPREVDEQLRLLQELAPEWIYEKTASSGDLLFCVNKISSPESIRARLLEANSEN